MTRTSMHNTSCFHKHAVRQWQLYLSFLLAKIKNEYRSVLWRKRGENESLSNIMGNMVFGRKIIVIQAESNRKKKLFGNNNIQM